MTTYHAVIRGEDRTEFTVMTEAPSPEVARQNFQELYPEGSILEVFDPVVREQEIYDRVCRRMDDDDVYYEED